MCNSLAIRVWDYDCGACMDYTEDYSPERLAELKARWDDPTCHISGAAAVCLALAEASHQLYQQLRKANLRVYVDCNEVFDDELPF